MYGIEPTHKEELRKKQAVRIFLEERLVEIGQVSAAFLNGLADACDATILAIPKAGKTLRGLKGYAIFGIVLAVVTFLMVY